MTDALFSLEDFGLRVEPTQAMREGTQVVDQCAWCGAVVVWHRHLPGEARAVPRVRHTAGLVGAEAARRRHPRTRPRLGARRIARSVHQVHVLPATRHKTEGRSVIVNVREPHRRTRRRRLQHDGASMVTAACPRR